jgi:TATA-box binding protein (TBP) (component of TFIID and TFIIIB)
MRQISNIKVSFTIHQNEKWLEQIEDLCKKNNILLKKRGNILIFKYNYSFCFFEKKNNHIHINATCIKIVSEIPYFKYFFLNNIINNQIFNFKIDNITSTFSFNRNINLNIIFNTFENVKYNPERFPGLFLKFKLFTAVIFRNGKINILGCKSTKDVYLSWIKIVQKISIALIP